MAQGTFIVIESTGGSDKSTQLQLLKERLEKSGYDVATMQFPRYDQPSSYFLREYLRNTYGTSEEVGFYTASLFYALDRYGAARTIQQWLDEGKVVLCDSFIAATMAHQGARIANPDARRGFFIWLDNLEFTMLKIPRPELTLVLYTPSEFIQEQPGAETQSGVTVTLDGHEANGDQMHHSVEAYLDLCRLFPKDFVRIDCARSGKMMDNAGIHNLLWGKVAPVLPEAPQPPVAAQQPQLAAEARQLTLQTSVLAASIMQTQLPLKTRAISATGYFIPPQLPEDTRAVYVDTMDHILKTAATIAEQLQAYTAKHPGADTTHANTAILQLLPLAAYVELHLPADRATQIKAMTTALAADARELQAIGAVIESMQPAYALPAPRNLSAEARLRQFAQENLPRQYTDSADTLTLVSYTPRNELQNIANILYAFTDQPLDAIQRQAATWPYDTKSSLYRDCVASLLQSGQSLASTLGDVSYDFDIVSDAATFNAILQTGQNVRIEWQQPSPRLGYDMPDIVEAAGLTELFDSCFDASLMLYSQMQQLETPELAPYAALQGHRLRWKVVISADTFVHWYRANNPLVCQLARSLYDKIAEVHPLLAVELKSVSKDEDQKLAAERYAQFKLQQAEQNPASAETPIRPLQQSSNN